MMSKHKVLGIILLFTCSMLFLFPVPVFADIPIPGTDLKIPFDNSSLRDGWIDPYAFLFNFHDVGADVKGDEKPLFMKYSILNYWFELDLLWAKIPGLGMIYIVCNALLSVMMLCMGACCLIVINLADWAFNYQGIDKITNYVDQFVTGLRDQLFFGELFGVMVFFLGVSLIFSFGRNEDVAGKLLKVIINLIIAFTLMANMSAIIKGINEIGKIGSNAVFIAFSSVPGFTTKNYVDGQPARNAMLNVYDGFFKYNFYKPWQLANYGLIVPESGPKDAIQQQVDRDTKEHLGGSFIQKYVIDQFENLGRNLFAQFKSIVNVLLPQEYEIDPGAGGYGYITTTPFGIPFRFFVVALTYIIGSAYGLLLLAIAGTTIFGKLVLLFLAMLAPLIFLLVLIPEWGEEVLLNWVKGVVAAGTYWIVASLMLVMILFLQHQLYEVSDGNWLIAMFLQCILLFTVFRFRNHIWDYIPISQMAMMNAAETAIFEKGKEALDKTREAAIEGGAFLALGGAAVATGNPAMLAGMGKSKLGAAGKGLFEEAAKIRRDSVEDGGKRTGMTKAMRQAIRNQFGLSQEQTAQRQTQSRSQQRTDNKEDQNFIASMNAATQAVRQFTAALQGVAAGGDMYKEVGNRSVGFKRGEYAVFDSENKKAFTIKKGQVYDAKDNVIGTIKGNRIFSFDRPNQKIGTIQNGEMTIRVPTAQGRSQEVTGKIYERTSAASTAGTKVTTGAKVVEENVKFKPKLDVQDQTASVHVQRTESVNVKRTESVDVNIRDSNVTANVTQHNTFKGGGDSSRSITDTPPINPKEQNVNVNIESSGQSSRSENVANTPIPNIQQPSNIQMPTLNVTVTGSGEKITNVYSGDSNVNVNQNVNQGEDSDSSPKSSEKGPDVGAVTGRGADDKATQDFLNYLDKSRAQQEQQRGFLQRFKDILGKFFGK